MASQNEIVWKKDLTDIQSGLETLATKTKISIDLSSMNYDKVKKINVAALETAVNNASLARHARDAKNARPVKGAKPARGARNASIT